MIKRCCFVLLLFAFVLGGCVSMHKGNNVEVNQIATSADKVRAGQVVLLLDPVVDYTLQSFSNDPVVMPAERSRIRDSLFVVLSAQFEAAGIRAVRQTRATDDPERVFLARRLASNYQQLMSLRNFSDDPLPSLGPVVNRLSEPSHSDLLVISRFSGAQKSVGQHRKDKLTASMRALVSLGSQKQVVLPQRYGELEVALIDGISGEIVWSAYTSGEPAELGSMINRLVETLPL